MKISVITVAYNSAATIGDTLDSVASQSHANTEHLVIDGLSSDSTLDLVRGHPNPAIRLISESDKGIYDAMNKGFAAATGDVIGFLNSDDIFADEGVLARIAAAFENPHVEMCFGDLVYVTYDNRRIVRYWRSRSFRAGDFARGWCPAHPTFYIRRNLLAQVGLFDLNFKLAADIEFMMRCLEGRRANAAYLPQVQVRMRLGGVTNSSFSNVLQQNGEVFAGLLKNDIAFSRFGFLIRKLANRLVQYLAANVRSRF